MSLNPALREAIVRIASKSERMMIRREVAREAMSHAIADEIHSITPEDANLHVLALTEMIVERLESLGVQLPKPRIRISAATQHVA